MDPLQLREHEIFETLKRLKGLDFVIIGGYAVNAYTLPRFSVDCDVVVEDADGADRIGTVLLACGYGKESLAKGSSFANFARYEKSIGAPFKVSFDLLIGEVLDRQSKAAISADWIFRNSRTMVLRGKTITEKLEARIINLDALFVMKMISCRSTDIRDLFMMATAMGDTGWIRAEVSSRYDFGERLKKLVGAITSKKFRDGLQGVYGFIDDKTFQKSVDAIESLGSEG
ncbi:MAG TPA: hypothetical protein VND15_03610 [Candidatus Acidoferrales bacterium]|nr:hypothetical protein [Candidatus Acidoferrales bacterium]